MEFYYLLFGGKGAKPIHTAGAFAISANVINNQAIIGIFQFRSLDPAMNQLLEVMEGMT